ncbi:hypothetical protein IVA88_24950 [Bradyrhizobium sp. 149]|uniref:hypothetical protein n=1 Tax=Bradyrhizobium sp. 149 TaxID=2782624 RepID=UPI001FF7DA94|nr:hypothetical protein [Bradyrhizobium sp. 149]MCK1654669.1 hypothetical protein [Bradyrhizobium sp. 149]
MSGDGRGLADTAQDRPYDDRQAARTLRWRYAGLGSRADAFPLDSDDLKNHVPNGRAMFDIARQSLVEMAEYIPSYRPAARRASKFCHAFGIFQCDIQFLDEKPDYFCSGNGLTSALVSTAVCTS